MTFLDRVWKRLFSPFEGGAERRDRRAAETFLETTADGESDEALNAYFDFIAQDDANAAEMSAYNEIWEGAGQIENPPWPAASELSAPEKATSRRVWIAASAAAAAVAVIAAGIFATPLLRTQETIEAFDVAEFATTRGEHRTVSLADGSTILLGGDTSLQTRTNTQERRVALRRGEAFFDVAPDTARPFYVEAGAVVVQVTGTSFNVLRSADIIAVSVRNGEVNVSSQLDATDKIAVLSEGQEVRIAFARRIGEVRTVDAAEVAAWRAGRLIIDDLPLDAAVASINRYYDGEIVIAGPRAQALRASGVIDPANPVEWLESLEDVLPVDVAVVSDDRIRILYQPDD